MYFDEDMICAAELFNVLLHFMFNHLCLMIFASFIPFLIPEKKLLNNKLMLMHFY